jgi:hypothetical protein
LPATANTRQTAAKTEKSFFIEITSKNKMLGLFSRRISRPARVNDFGSSSSCFQSVSDAIRIIVKNVPENTL